MSHISVAILEFCLPKNNNNNIYNLMSLFYMSETVINAGKNKVWRGILRLAVPLYNLSTWRDDNTTHHWEESENSLLDIFLLFFLIYLRLIAISPYPLSPTFTLSHYSVNSIHPHNDNSENNVVYNNKKATNTQIHLIIPSGGLNAKPKYLV